MRVLLWVAVGAAIGAVVGFGAGRWSAPSEHATPTTVPTIPTTTTLPPVLTVTPTVGPVGTTFTLAARGLKPGVNARFEVDMPDGKVFNGQPHVVGTDGAVLTTFVATKGNPSGTYAVKVTDDTGATAHAEFAVGQPSATTRPTSTSSTRGLTTTTSR